jgi:hypothetical protein
LVVVVVAAVAMAVEKVESVHQLLLGHLIGLQVHLKKQKSLWMMHHSGKVVEKISLQSFPF